MDNVLPDDGLKWFGEGFDGFPKRLPDDCVEYIIYIINDNLSTLSAVRSRLNEILKLTNELKKQHLKDYIWQRDGFKLSLDPGHVQVDGDETQTPTPPHLRGQTNFGDSIADEWCIVWLLREISRAFPDAWIRIYDTDGEFLLIEAADALPRWLNPEIAENRVWMNAGQLKIIPLAANGREPKSETQGKAVDESLTLPVALSLLRHPGSTGLLVDPKIQEAAFQRVAAYPAALATHLHCALTTLPRKLAWLLHSLPTSIAAATEAFYLRDAVSLRPLATKDLATLRFPPEDLVDVSVAYTRVGFAQLRGQVLSPVPPAWVGVAPRIARGDAKMEVGVKVACGFEMLMRDPAQTDSKVVREVEVLLSELEEEGGDLALPSDEEIKGWGQRVDSEDWLDVDYKDLEKELDGKGSKVQGEEKDGEQTAQENLRQVVERFRKFMDDDDADVDGIDDMDDDNDDDDDDDDDDDENDEFDEQPTQEEYAEGKTTSSEPHRNDTTSDDEDNPLNPPAPATAYPTTLPTTSMTSPSMSNPSNSNGASSNAKTSNNENASPHDWQSHLAAIEFEKAISDVHGMTEAEIESSGLLAEARKLALEDSRGDHGGDSTDQEDDEDAELEKIMALMEKELRDRGALDLGDGKGGDGKKKSTSDKRSKATAKPVFGPERPPHMLVKSSATSAAALDHDDDSDYDSDTIPSDVESDADDDQDFNNVDLNLARNLLSAFQGEAGQAGPAGNLMRALGVTGTLPRDEDAGRITEEKN